MLAGSRPVTAEMLSGVAKLQQFWIPYYSICYSPRSRPVFGSSVPGTGYRTTPVTATISYSVGLEDGMKVIVASVTRDHSHQNANQGS